jgi:hypothetical protein
VVSLCLPLLCALLAAICRFGLTRALRVVSWRRHGKADPGKLDGIKRISLQAWDELNGKYGGTPVDGKGRC